MLKFCVKVYNSAMDPYHWQKLKKLTPLHLWIAEFIDCYVKVLLPSVRPYGRQRIHAHGLEAQVAIAHIQAWSTPNKFHLFYFSEIDGGVNKMYPDVYKFRWCALKGVDSIRDVEVIIKWRLCRCQGIMNLVVVFQTALLDPWFVSWLVRAFCWVNRVQRRYGCCHLKSDQ